MFAEFPSMGRRHDRSARDSGPGPSANDNGPTLSSALPRDARAIVEPLPVATNQGSRVASGKWRVRFQPRRGPSADALTGWTGGGDPLETIELRFPDRQSAEGYCRRQGVPFTCREEPKGRRSSAPLPVANAPPVICCLPTGPHTLGCGLYGFAS